MQFLKGVLGGCKHTTNRTGPDRAHVSRWKVSASCFPHNTTTDPWTNLTHSCQPMISFHTPTRQECEEEQVSVVMKDVFVSMLWTNRAVMRQECNWATCKQLGARSLKECRVLCSAGLGLQLNRFTNKATFCQFCSPDNSDTCWSVTQPPRCFMASVRSEAECDTADGFWNVIDRVCVYVVAASFSARRS